VTASGAVSLPILTHPAGGDSKAISIAVSYRSPRRWGDEQRHIRRHKRSQITRLACRCWDLEDDFSEMLSFLHVADCGDGVCPRKHLIDDRRMLFASIARFIASNDTLDPTGMPRTVAR